MGHHCGNAQPNVHISRVPVFCTNAYILTFEGACLLYNYITRNYPYELEAIDVMLVRLQMAILDSKRGVANPQSPSRSSSQTFEFEWYAWNSEMFPDNDSYALINPGQVVRDKGLVFQQYKYDE